MGQGDPLGPTTRCPLASRCEACASTRELEVATYQTPVGVFCATACGPCIDQAKAPPVRGWAQACERVGAHCEHLGIDLDQMAAILHAEREQGEAERLADAVDAYDQATRVPPTSRGGQW